MSRVDPVLTAAAGLDLVGSGAVEVRCWSPDDWDAVLVAELTDVLARGDAHARLHRRLRLARERARASPARGLRCARRRGSRPGGRRRGRALRRSSRSRTSSSTSSSEQSGEAATECAALQTAERVGGLLGIPAATSRRLVLDYLDEVYADLPDEYRSPACHDGGALDLHPGSARLAVARAPGPAAAAPTVGRDAVRALARAAGRRRRR